MKSNAGRPQLPEKATPDSGYRYATASKTNDFLDWLATDGPTDYVSLADLRRILRGAAAAGQYSLKAIKEGWEGETKWRIRIQGPHRRLVIPPLALSLLYRELNRIRGREDFRRECNGR